MGGLIVAYGNELRLIDEDVRGHQQRVAKEAEVRQILAGEVFLLLFVSGHTFQPAERGNHAQQQIEFGLLQHLALQKQHTFRGIESGAQVVEDHVQGIGLDLRGVGVVGSESVPVGDEEVTLILALKLDPVGQGAHVVAKVELAGGAHAAEDTRTRR